jgi:hypothetical protein
MLRPSGLAFVSVVLALGAIGLLLWPTGREIKAAPLPVSPDDREIVWLAPATSTASWERFLSAVKKTAADLRALRHGPDPREDDSNAFPEQTTAAPEIAISLPGKKGRLWLRWYKLTSDLTAEDWIEALFNRNPPPLAVIGGNASDQAIDMARSMDQAARRHHLERTAPLLLLTQATAQEVGPGEPSLNSLYPVRTFRFCFSNRQMSRVVTDFLWSQEDFRPDSGPVYLTHWDDDPYSKDLNQCFCEALTLLPVQAAARCWGWQAGVAGSGAFPLDLAGLSWGQFWSVTPESSCIYYSVGTYAEPNRWEEEEALRLMETKAEQHPQQQRPLLIIPAATQPTRRFLRALIRTAPQEARRFVVATGDSIAFNTLYRDRNMSWPIQDLPFSLVVFCHRNPVDREAGFTPEPDPVPAGAEESSQASAGTEDLLLFMDIVNALVRGCLYEDPGPATDVLPKDASALRDRLVHARWCGPAAGVCFGENGVPFFDEEGNRRSGTGEHVVALLPVFKGDTVMPEALLEIWAWNPKQEGSREPWQRVDRLPVRYEGYPPPN